MPLLNYPHQPAEVSRSGNQHRKFIPTDVFRTLGGYIYMAVGNDIQWRRLVVTKHFGGRDAPFEYRNPDGLSPDAIPLERVSVRYLQEQQRGQARR